MHSVKAMPSASCRCATMSLTDQPSGLGHAATCGGRPSRRVRSTVGVLRSTARAPAISVLVIAGLLADRRTADSVRRRSHAGSRAGCLPRCHQAHDLVALGLEGVRAREILLGPDGVAFDAL